MPTFIFHETEKVVKPMDVNTILLAKKNCKQHCIQNTNHNRDFHKKKLF